MGAQSSDLRSLTDSLKDKNGYASRARQGVPIREPYSESHVAPVSYVIPGFESESKKSTILKVVSWNLCGTTNSSYTPVDWDKNNDKWEHVHEQVSEQSPDIISYQELDSNLLTHPLMQRHQDSGDWLFGEALMSHAGYTRLLVHRRVQDDLGFSIELDGPNRVAPANNYPRLILRSKLMHESEAVKSSLCLALYGCHLPPFKNGAQKRALAVQSMWEEAKALTTGHDGSDFFVLVGDTNMRYEEEKPLLDSLQQLRCCWDIVPEQEKKDQFYTWYKSFFTAGAEGISRFDKVLYSSKFDCLSLGVFDRAVSPSPFHFLSDHRAIVSHLRL